mgnify:CR=1 FL=1|tara:strand:+ start:179 stop:784 length:606 start_codon:yes stop_codon:yes gene_type:complete
MSDEQAMIIIENLTEELGEKEEKIMQLEKINKDLQFERNILKKYGNFIYQTAYGGEEAFQDFMNHINDNEDHHYTSIVEPCNSYEDKVKAVKIFIENEDDFSQVNYEILTDKEIREWIKDHYESISDYRFIEGEDDNPHDQQGSEMDTRLFNMREILCGRFHWSYIEGMNTVYLSPVEYYTYLFRNNEDEPVYLIQWYNDC